MHESERLLLLQSQRVARLGHYVLDVPTGRWTCSDVLAEIFGLQPGGTYGLSEWMEALHPDDRDDTVAYFQREVLGKGAPFDREYRLVHRTSGETVWVHGLGTLDLDGEGRPARMFGTIQDVTARKAAELALAESEARLLAVFEGVSDGLVVAELASQRFVLSNRGFSELTGYSADEVRALGVSQLHPAESLPYVQGWFERQARGEAVVAPDIPVRRKDGSVLLCDVSASSIVVSGRPCLMGSFRDITYRRRIEHALRLKDFVFQSAMTANSISDTEGTLIEANPAFLRTWGCTSPDQVIGHRISEFLAHEHEMHEILAALQATGSWSGEYTARRPDGSTFRASSQATAVRDEQGRVVGYQSAVLDVTDRRHAEEEKERLRAQLVQAQKMESIGRLAGGVAHDFNNMLGVILGYTDLLLDDLPDDHPHHATVLGIRSATQRSAELTRQLLAFARRQTVAPRIVDLNGTVAGALRMLRRLIGEDIELAWRPLPEPCPIRVDPSQIDQILANLCVNSRDAISGVGKVTIETSVHTLDQAESDRQGASGAGEYVALSVTDDGCGMTPDVLAHVFEPFFTTKALGQGTGLGLATLYGIAKQNGGFVTVASEPGRGSTFRVLLPRHAGDLPGAVEGTAMPEVPGRSATVLLVEDEPMLLSMCQAVLHSLGFRVLPAGSPLEALSLADAHAREIELLVTDVVMPQMTGIELAARLTATIPRLKRLFMSGYAADAFASDGLLDEGVHFLQKPFSRRDLAAAVNEAMKDG